MTYSDSPHDVRLNVRIPRAQSDRIDLLARCTGRTRSDYVRAALEIVNAELLLDAVRQIEERGPLTPEHQAKKKLALINLTALIVAMRPKVLEI